MRSRSRLASILFLTLGSYLASTTVMADDSAFEPALTPWGTPDLQGVWDFRTLTPLERPLEFGDKAVLTASEAKALLNKILPPDRKDEPTGIPTQDVEGYNSFWLDAGESLDKEMRTSLIVDPPNGRLPEVVESADAARIAQNKQRQAPVRDVLSYSVGPNYLHQNPESLGLSERCLLGFNAGPPITPSAYNNNLRIVQTPTHVVLVTEMIHDARIIPTDGRGHLPDDIHQWYGSSRATWEGNTLVVETKNFTDKTPAFHLPVQFMRPHDNGVLGSGRDLHLTERFTMTAPGQLSYETTVNAPTSFKRPFTMRVSMLSSEDKIFEYACHEGNYAMGGILRGARLQERESGLNLQATTNDP
ncbi:MAG: hypothetical protein GKR90_23610 [Pseudomonadales bacterium]|nr:hypothetical protein [Pseudomonadales bacterium]